MLLQRTATARAKINLGLHVLRRRPDGYHDIDTVFVRIGWSDVVTVESAPHLSMSCDDPDLPVDMSNLCMRAASMLGEASGVALGASIHLEKRVPYGSGLGGGSSDAATTLLLLNDLWDLSLPRERLSEIAAGVGSDVPFFLGAGAARGTGRGELLARLTDGPANTGYRFPFFLAVVVPPISVSTAEAYAGVVPAAGARPDLDELVGSNDPERWKAELRNDFEASVFGRHPEIQELKKALLGQGAVYASLSGSGSAVFGVFEELRTAWTAVRKPVFSGCRVWAGETAA
jgi:4-diphosphocytidyl-2-C-methyl-D-erythritol kinase